MVSKKACCSIGYTLIRTTEPSDYRHRIQQLLTHRSSRPI